MAGAGYKDFTAGDVLTAAQLDTYLMHQSTMVFASASARDTALSGVIAEGMTCYLSDVNRLEVYDGAAWQTLGVHAAWAAPTLVNSWADFGGGNQVAQYRKVGDTVQMRGIVKSGATSTEAFTLPSGFRPPAPANIGSIDATSTPTAALIAIGTAGVVQIFCSSIVAISLDVQFSTVA
jgi:hypothetical protein